MKRAFVKWYLTSPVDCKFMKCLLNIPKPWLAFKAHFFRGGTGYIDGICKKDVAHGICHGRDCYGRFFITIKYKCLTPFTFDGTLVSPDPEKEYIFTCFQRTSHASSTWCKAGPNANDGPLLYGSNVALNDKQKRILLFNIFTMLNEDKRNAENQNLCKYMDYYSKTENYPTQIRTFRLQLS